MEWEPDLGPISAGAGGPGFLFVPGRAQGCPADTSNGASDGGPFEGPAGLVTDDATDKGSGSGTTNGPPLAIDVALVGISGGATREEQRQHGG